MEMETVKATKTPDVESPMGVQFKYTFIYVNGLKTKYPVADYQRRLLCKALGMQVRLVYNPTLLWTTGLLECFFQRWFFKVFATPQVKMVTRQAMEELWHTETGYQDRDRNNLLVLIGHSQGCLQVINAARRLPEVYKKRVVLILFACPSAFLPTDLRFIEVFRNEHDWALEALAFTRQKDNAVTYTGKGMEHGFVDGYLQRIKQFSGHEKSLFYRLMQFHT